MTYTIQRLLSLNLPGANFIETHDFHGKLSVFVFICGKYVLTYGFGFKVTLVSRSYIILLSSGEQKLFAPALHKFKIWGVSTAPEYNKNIGQCCDNAKRNVKNGVYDESCFKRIVSCCWHVMVTLKAVTEFIRRMSKWNILHIEVLTSSRSSFTM